MEAFKPAGQQVRASAHPRFCPGCGTAWNALWVECPICAKRRPVSTGPARIKDIRGALRGSVQALALYFSILALLAIGNIIASHCDLAQAVRLMFVLSAVMSILVVAWCVVDQRDIAPLLRVRPAPAWYALGVGGALGTFAVAQLALTALHHAFGMPMVDTDVVTRAGYNIPAAIMVTCLQPAVIEELAFRGVVLTNLQRLLSNREAILVSAALFSILHLSFPSIPHLFVIGLALGFLRVQTGSLYPGMALHFTHNFLCILWEHHAI
jgi:membrane protease YdiL (CAAX protease family)